MQAGGYEVPFEGKIEAYNEMLSKFDQKKRVNLSSLSKNLDEPFTGNTGSSFINEDGQIEQTKGKKKRGNRNDPLKKIFGTNQRVCRFKKI